MAATAVATFVVAVALMAVPGGATALAPERGAIPAFDSLTAFADLFTAVLLIGQAYAAGSRAAMRLAAAYLFSVLLVIPHLLSFPGALVDGVVIGGVGTAAWLWCAWQAGFALFVSFFALSREQGQPASRQGRGVLGVAMLAAVGVVLLAIFGLKWLPAILMGDDYGQLNRLGIGAVVAVCNLGALTLVVVRLRARNTVTLWLTVAMVAICLDGMLSLVGAQRFTRGWYWGHGFGLLGHVTVFMALLFESMQLYSRVSEANRHLERLSLTDQLTQLPNRRAFEANLAVEWRRAEREMLPISLLMVDVDRFKAFNDRFGHPAGDRCLRLVADTLGELARRPLDLAARMGGEEFVLLLPNTDVAGAIWMGERVRAAIAALGITNPGSFTNVVTVSVGVASEYPVPRGGIGSADLIERADTALYAAKRMGRNSVHVYSPEAGSAYPADAIAWCAADMVSQIAH